MLRDPRIGRFLRELFARAMAPFMPSVPGVRHELGAEHRKQRAPFERHRLRHGEDELVTLRRRDERERDARVALVGSMMKVSF